MALINLFKSIIKCNRSTKEKINKLNIRLSDKAIVEKMKTNFQMEDLCLSSLMDNSKNHVLNPSEYAESHDVANKIYLNLLLLDQLFNNDKPNLLAIKKDVFIYPLDEIKQPVLLNTEDQAAANSQYSQLLTKRQRKLNEIKKTLEESSTLAETFCIYLARSNYPKLNAFEILPRNLVKLFDTERMNAEHLKGEKIPRAIVSLEL